MNKPLIIITGASSGIGAAVAKIFSESDYPLCLIARNSDAMENLNLSNAICQSIDVTDYPSFKKAIQIAEDKFGPADCLINNAGFGKAGEFTEVNHADHERMIMLNILGVTNGIEIVLPDMQRRKTGTIINISSVADRNARPNMSVYAATKAAIKSLSESLRMDNAKHGIRVCNIAPAKILTPLSKTVIQNQGEKELIPADDFAKMIFWVYQQPQTICIRDMVVSPTNYEP